MTADRAMNTSVDESQVMLGRESGIMEVVNREASPVTSAMEPPRPGDADIDVDTELEAAGASTRAAAAANSPETPRTGVAAPDVSEDEAIEVADDEIELAIPSSASGASPSSRAPSSSTPSSSGLPPRSRPPARPSTAARPRLPSLSSTLPPPQHVVSLPASSRPGWSGADPWLLANKTLELSRAVARIEELEESLAFRDARIATLEESLAQAQVKLGDLQAAQQKLNSRSPNAQPAARTAPAGRGTELQPDPELDGAVTGTRSSNAYDAPPTRVQRSSSALISSAPYERSSARHAPAAGTEGHSTDLASREGGTEEDEATGEDLLQISGIGPRFQAALRKQGITRLSQIAAWSEADVRQVAKALKIPKSRIVKGRWIESAREAIGSGPASE
jgi:predicted flap endonuclease-1-like 5' DNA nuclease/uncharacterized coiled-coil protein SlyX